MSPHKPIYELNHGEGLMRLVGTTLTSARKITDAKHAETINDQELISSFIREKRNLQHELSILGCRRSEPLTLWCNCHENMVAPITQ
jgi:hypothetical protein